VSAGAAKAKEPKALPAPLGAEEIAKLEAQKPTDRFAAVGGWSPSPNLLLEHHNKFSGHVQSILAQEIVRWTFGHERGVHEWALIKFGPLAKRSGYTAKAFELALNEGSDKTKNRLLFRRLKEGRHWLCKIVPEDLKSVARYDRGGNPSPVPYPAGRDEAGRFTLSKTPIPMSELFAGVPVEAAAAQFVSDVQTSRPVDVALAVALDGVVSVLVRDAAPTVPEGSVLAKESIKTPTHFATVRSLFASYHAVLDPIFLELFKKVPDKALLTEILALSDGAPAEMLGARIDEKIAAGSFKASGLVLGLARDLGEAWRLDASLRQEAKRIATVDGEERERRHGEWERTHCPACEGRGSIGVDDCSECHGTGQRPQA
jgi:hypothetical protein